MIVKIDYFKLFILAIVVVFVFGFKNANGADNQLPKGNFDYAGCDFFSGWTCDADDYSASLPVHFYADGPYPSGTLVTYSPAAKLPREAGVAAACGGNTNHGFQVATPASLKDGKAHTIYMYSINTPAGDNPLLGTKTIQCQAQPTNSAPIGSFDSADCNSFNGWSCDADNYSQPLDVHFYVDGDYNTGKFLGSDTANKTREQAVGNLCGQNGNHGFQFITPSALKDGTQHTIYAYAINTPAGDNPLLGAKTIQCQAPISAPAGSLDSANCTSLSGWACDPTSPGDTAYIYFYDGKYNDTADAAQHYIGRTRASRLRYDVSSMCGNTPAHGFSVSTPASLTHGTGHNVYAKGAIFGDNTVKEWFDLSGSPKVPDCNGSSSLCGNGVWDKGETLANCPSDCNEYCNPPADNIDILPTGGYIIGTYVFPGWHADANYPKTELKDVWNISGSDGTGVINAVPASAGADQPKKPLIGYYDDTNQIATDHMIKMGLEHGVSLFVYDWYWQAGKPLLQEPLENTFIKSKYFSKYPDKLKFAIMLTLNSIPKDDLVAMMNYDIKNYFKYPQYLTIDDKPVVFIYDYGQIIRALGRQQTIDLFSQWKQMAEAAGYKDLILISEAGSLTPVHGCGDPALGISGNAFYAWIMPTQTTASGLKWDTYDNFTSTYKSVWNNLLSCPNAPYYFPTISTGWDSTDIGSDGVAYINSTPDKYKALALAAKNFVDQKNIQPKIIINEAWDEWSEGAVLAPTQKWGFGYLDAIKNVFGQTSPTCQNQCASGAKQCNGSGYQTCGDANSDGCLEWGSVTACASGQTCSDGSCVAGCTPTTCAVLGHDCGAVADGCGGMLSCGSCASNQTCQSGSCVDSGSIVNPPPFTPTTITKPVAKMTRAEILAKITEIKKLLIQLIQQLIVELQKQLAVIKS